MVESEEYNAWNTGMETPVPSKYAHLATVLHPDNLLNDLEEVSELSKFLGVSKNEVAVCKPERLVLHEVLVRVMAEIDIADGEHYTDLGTKFRATTKALLQGYINPHMNELETAYHHLRGNISERVDAILDETLFAKNKPQPELKVGFLKSLFNPKAKPSSLPALSVEQQQQLHIKDYGKKYRESEKSVERSIYKYMEHVANALIAQYGRVWNDKELFNKLVTNMVCNEYGSKALGDKIHPYIQQGIDELGIKRVAETDTPIIISLKGASASGKSSLRLAIKKNPQDFLEGSGVDSIEGFAIISPDICRKMLLDYDSLGEGYKYAGPLTAEELVFIDRKVDRYLREKTSTQQSLPNLLIDRFRFDTFTVSEYEGSNSYVMKADHLHMFFIVTDPAEIVERGWNRGLETGRYRATEDFLALGIEAYDGIPNKFFHWLGEEGQDFDYKFFNNNVPKGTPFIKAGFGTRDEMTIYDVQTFLDIIKNKKVNIYASNKDEVFKDEKSILPENNMSFIARCVEEVPSVRFVDAKTDRVYAKTQNAVPMITDREIFHEKLDDTAYSAVFKALGFAKLPEFSNEYQHTNLDP